MELIVQAIDNKLDELLPQESVPPTLLHTAMRYSVFAGGKRVRPLLCIATCQALGGSMQDALVCACAVEVLHKYTLIHDDLPAMDNDDVRSGKASCHKQFNEATAILAGDALLTLAFEWLGRTGNAQAVVDLAQFTGSLGTIGGQQDDMLMKEVLPDQESLLEMQRKKAANLMSVACVIGARCANASDKDIDHVRRFGDSLGMTLQLLDDVCDNDPVTMSVIGREETMKLARSYMESSNAELSSITRDTEQLRAIAEYLYASFKI